MMETSASLLSIWIAMAAVAQDVVWRYHWNLWQLGARRSGLHLITRKGSKS